MTEIRHKIGADAWAQVVAECEAMALFEFALIIWNELENLHNERDWDVWSSTQSWEWLAPMQQHRFRCGEDVLFIGDGMQSVPYRQVDHPSMAWKPNWALFLTRITVDVGMCLEAVVRCKRLKRLSAACCFQFVLFGHLFVTGSLTLSTGTSTRLAAAWWCVLEVTHKA